MSRLVFTADLHVHGHRVDSADGGRDRLQDGLSALRQTLDYARQYNAVWVFGGDLKVPRRSWPHDALTGCLAVLREYDDVSKYLVAGNHDGDGDYGSGLRPFAGASTFVVERPGVVDIVGVGPVAVWPAVPGEHDPADWLPSVPPGVRLLVGHGYVAGAKTGPDDFRAPSSLTLDRLGLLAGRWDVALFGDVHKAQVLARNKRGPGAEWVSLSAMPAGVLSGEVPMRSAGAWRGEVYYPGSPYQQNFGERNDGPKGALLVDLSTGGVWFLPVKGPKFIYVEIDG